MTNCEAAHAIRQICVRLQAASTQSAGLNASMRWVTQAIVLGPVAVVLLHFSNITCSRITVHLHIIVAGTIKAMHSLCTRRQMQTGKVSLTNGVTCLDIRLGQPVQLFHWLDPCKEGPSVDASKLLASTVISQTSFTLELAKPLSHVRYSRQTFCQTSAAENPSFSHILRVCMALSLKVTD